MEGPTPVSSLLHSATLVTIGVILVSRLLLIADFNTFYFLFPISYVILSLLSLTTYDVKRSIAFTTATQVSAMFYVPFQCRMSTNTHVFTFFYKAFYSCSLVLIYILILIYRI